MDVGGLQLIGQRLAARISHVGDDDLRAFLRKAARAGFANALAGAGDDGDTACKAEADGIVGRGHGCFSFSEVEDEKGRWRLLGKREQLWES